METDFSSLQQSHSSESDCTGYIYKNKHEDCCLLGYDAASCPRRILPWVMMLHHILEGFRRGLWCCIVSQRVSALGYDDASYPGRLPSWTVMLHCIPEGFRPGLWCYIRSQKNIILKHTAVKASEHKKIRILDVTYFTSYCSKWIRVLYFCPGYQSGVNYSTNATNCAGRTVEIVQHLYEELCPVDTHWICVVILTQRNTNVQ
jgi:hypothetical protein